MEQNEGHAGAVPDVLHAQAGQFGILVFTVSVCRHRLFFPCGQAALVQLQATATGSTHRGLSFAGLLPRVLTEWTVIRLARKPRLKLIRRQDHRHAVVNGRHDPLAAVVRLVQISIISAGCNSASAPVRVVSSRTVQCSHSPVKANSPSPFSPNNYGYFSAPRRAHS